MKKNVVALDKHNLLWRHNLLASREILLKWSIRASLTHLIYKSLINPICDKKSM